MVKTSKKPTIIDLFCGCGGLSFGFEKAGYQVLLGIDNWEQSLKTFKANHNGAETHLGDLSKTTPQEIANQYKVKNVDVIIGGPPCQGFSISGKRLTEDPRNFLYKGFVNFVSYFKPKAFLMENVPNLIAMGGGKIKEKILEDFTSLGYTVSYKVLLASDYGVPQNRKRVVFIGLLNGKTFEFPKPIFGENLKSKITANDAISDLPEGSVVDGSKYNTNPTSEYQRLMRAESDGLYNHQTCKHSDQTVKIISLVPDGGNYKNLPENLRDTRKVNIAWTRLNSAKPSFTIDTGHRHHFHYKYNRIPTPREAARIQSFPDSFIFHGTSTGQAKQVGNAVPPLLGEILAKQLSVFLNQ
ncbi:DNA cytosine methyltransferase [Candidatus Peregrinibacteria bacterium]|nr:MAG: DNA cytosine methyltransferase [Candidatus Peregrinibacteria bacterium]